MNFSQLARLQALKKHLEVFQKNHPRFQHFLNAVSRDALKEDSVIEINVTTPEGKNMLPILSLRRMIWIFCRLCRSFAADSLPLHRPEQTSASFRNAGSRSFLFSLF